MGCSGTQGVAPPRARTWSILTGHGRYETLALGILLLVVAVGIGWDAGKRLFAPDQLLRPLPPALAAILVSILVKEWLYWWTLGYVRRVRSDMLHANA